MQVKSNKTIDEAVNETTVTTLSKEEVVALVRSSISTLYKRNKKLITLFDKKMENGFLSDTEQVEFLDGMYCAILDYSKKNKTAQETITKYGFQINESLKDYKDQNKPLIWKIGYATIQYEIVNRSTRRLRLYLDLFMTSKESRFVSAGNYNHTWDISASEKKYMEYLQIVLAKAAERVQIEKESGEDMKNIFMNFSKPTNSSEFYWPFRFDNNPANAKELQTLIKISGYEDNDIDMASNAVFTTDNKYALGLITKADDCYLFISKKTAHYWDALLVDGKSVFLKYNFTRTFNENIQLLLQYYESIFPIRIKK